MIDNNSAVGSRRLTADEIHELAIAPLPIFNIIPGKSYGGGSGYATNKYYHSDLFHEIGIRINDADEKKKKEE